MGLLNYFRRSPKVDPRLIGRWRLIRTEDEIDAGDGVTAEFSRDGSLTYTIRLPDRLQVIRLTYRVEGGELVTDQPSVPREERTKYTVDRDQLILDNQGRRSWFGRELGGDA